MLSTTIVTVGLTLAAAATSTAVRPARAAVVGEPLRVYSVEHGRLVPSHRVVKSEEEWRAILTEEQYRVVREGGTEVAFTGATWDNHAPGVYRCVACGNDLFLSSRKYDSGTGWPSFTAPVHPANVATSTDTTFLMVRTEVHCARCGAHLGHLFEDGPPPTGLRYCLNSAALGFAPSTR